MLHTYRKNPTDDSYFRVSVAAFEESIKTDGFCVSIKDNCDTLVFERKILAGEAKDKFYAETVACTKEEFMRHYFDYIEIHDELSLALISIKELF